jgi:putative intracellular protease/amidase
MVKMTRSTETQPAKPKKIGILLFPGFETLDVYGPVQMWGRLPDHDIVMISQDGRPVVSSQALTTTVNHSFETAPGFDILMVPGGMGTRTEVDNAAILDFIRLQDRTSEWTTSVCTGAALLARAGVLDGRNATSNKVAFEWVASQANAVCWQRRARWVVDGKYATASGVSAGMDMALDLVERIYGRAQADAAARLAEYRWHDDPADDPFALEGA